MWCCLGCKPCEELKVFRLYLFSQLEQCSQNDLFPGAWALTALIALFLLVSVGCYLLMFQVCGENVTFTKGTLSLGIIKYGKSFVPGCLPCGFHVCLSWWAFPFCFTSLPGLPSVPLSPEAGHRSCNTILAVQCLPHQSLQILPCAELPLTRKSLWVFYVWMERNGSLGLSQRFLMWHKTLWHPLGQRAFNAPGFRFAFCLQRVFQNCGEKWVSTTKVIQNPWARVLTLIRDHENYSLPHPQVEDNMPCHAAFTAVILLSPLPWAHPEKRSLPLVPVETCHCPWGGWTRWALLPPNGEVQQSWWCSLRPPYLASCKQSRSC